MQIKFYQKFSAKIIWALKLLHEERLQRPVGGKHRLALQFVHLLLGSLSFLLGFIELNAHHFGEFTYRFGKVQVTIMHDEGNGVATFVASAEAVPRVA